MRLKKIHFAMNLRWNILKVNLQFWKNYSWIFLILLFGLSIFIFNFKGSDESKGLGDFGGFIGGIWTSLSIYLLFITYLNAMQANELAKVESFYQGLNSEINDASFDEKRGTDAYLFFDLETKITHSILDNLNVVLSSFEIYLDFIEESRLLSKRDKERCKTRFYLMFYSKVLWPLRHTISSNGEGFMKKHDDSHLILPKYCNLGIQAISCLSEKNFIVRSRFKEDTMSGFRRIIEKGKQMTENISKESQG